MGDRIPIVEVYRGVGIHDSQSADRIAHIVKPAIDRVLGIADVASLVDYARDIREPPEARLLAAAKAEAAFEIAAEERRVRPDLDLDVLHACVAGLDSINWRDPHQYCSLLDLALSGSAGAAVRDKPLQDS